MDILKKYIPVVHKLSRFVFRLKRERNEINVSQLLLESRAVRRHGYSEVQMNVNVPGFKK